MPVTPTCWLQKQGGWEKWLRVGLGCVLSLKLSWATWDSIVTLKTNKQKNPVKYPKMEIKKTPVYESMQSYKKMFSFMPHLSSGPLQTCQNFPNPNTKHQWGCGTALLSHCWWRCKGCSLYRFGTQAILNISPRNLEWHDMLHLLMTPQTLHTDDNT